MDASFQLGILDLCKVFPGTKPADALWAAVELAPLLESYGYTRYWLAEHHTEDVAHSSPELLVPVLAGLTKRMRVGTAGVLLRFYSPLKVAKNFRLLHALFPGRIDLGLARGSAPPVVQRLLGVDGAAAQRYEDVDAYKVKVGELLGYLRGTGEIIANPANVAPPDVWILGSKSSSMRLAAQSGTAFCLALFLEDGREPVDSVSIIEEYRASFQPSRELSAARWSLAVGGVCAPTEVVAREIVANYGPGVAASVVGTPKQCRDTFEALRDAHGTSEFAFLDLSPTFETRARSCRLLAEVLELKSKELDFERAPG